MGIASREGGNRVIGRQFAVSASSETLDAELEHAADGKGIVEAKPIAPEATAKLHKLTAPRNRCQAGTVAQRARPYVPFSGGETSTLNITSFTDFALAGNRGKDSNRALQFGQCQR